MSGIESMPLLELSKFIFFILAVELVVKKRPIQKKSKISVAALYIYPIKSCKGIKVDRAHISKRGFLYDRLFMVIDESGKFVSQRTQPKMCFVETRVNFESKTLTISAPTMKTALTIPLDGPKNGISEAIRVTVWGDECSANEAFGEEGNRWFQEYLGVPSLRLVRMSDDCVRKTDENYAPESQVAFSDGFPFLLCSNSSIATLNQKLEKPIPITNFRPNIIVDCEEPFAEDKWGKIEFHHSDAACQPMVVPMKVVKPCSRCKVPTIDQSTAQFDPNNEPARSMKSFRSGEAMGLREESWRRELFFGQNVDHSGRGVGEVRVGDALEVRSYQTF